MSQGEPDNTTVRQILLNDCDNYIHNSLPTFLLDISSIRTPTDPIRLNDIKLVSRSQISKAILDQVESDLRAIPSFDREKWCKVRLDRPRSECRLIDDRGRPGCVDTSPNTAMLLRRIDGVGTSPHFSRCCRERNTPQENRLRASENCWVSARLLLQSTSAHMLGRTLVA